MTGSNPSHLPLSPSPFPPTGEVAEARGSESSAGAGNCLRRCEDPDPMVITPVLPKHRM